MSGSVDIEHRAIERSVTRELAEAFAASMAAADRDGLAGLLSEGVVYQSPGRSRVAGLHSGRDATIDALTTPAEPGATVDAVELTELMVDGRRAFLTVLLAGSRSDEVFSFEIGFHVQTDGEFVTGVTEYCGDQHTMDALLGSPTPTSVSSSDEKSIRLSARSRLARLLRRS